MYEDLLRQIEEIGKKIDAIAMPKIRTLQEIMEDYYDTKESPITIGRIEQSPERTYQGIDI